MLQDTWDQPPQKIEEHQTPVRTGRRSLQLEPPAKLPECYVTQRVSPSYDIAKLTCDASELAMCEADVVNTLRLMIRNISASTSQQVPAWSGFISMTGKVPESLTTISYYPVVPFPITLYSTIQECLRISEVATTEVGQKYVITTFDLGACMLALPLIWKYPVKYKSHIILLGSFHIISAYFKGVGKKIKASGLADILIEAGISTASLEGIETGKNYERCLKWHKVFLEALERLLLHKYLCDNENESSRNLPEESKQLLNDFIESPTEANLHKVVNDANIYSLTEKYIKYKERVLKGKLGKTAQFWARYMEHIWLVIKLLYAIPCILCTSQLSCIY